jgi:hypothetical protein
MPLAKDIKQKFDDLRAYLNHSCNTTLKLESNGGNSILLVYPPEEEQNYLSRVQEEFSNCCFIDIAIILTEFIDQFGLEKFVELYDAYSPEPQKLFSSTKFENNFINLVISKITESVQNGKIPVLIRTGALFGTSIGNAVIIDSELVKSLSLPLVILYPGKYEGEKLMFLNFHQASKYRSVIIN